MTDANAIYERLEMAHLADAARLLQQGIDMIHQAVGLKIRLANICSRLRGYPETDLVVRCDFSDS